MAMALQALSGRAVIFAARQPRIAVGGTILSCIVLAELVAAVTINGFS